MKKSIIAAVVTPVVGLVSMGLLGAVLAFAAWPVVYPLAGNPNDWVGDDVWPALIWAGVLWGFAFLAAGWVNRRLVAAGWSPRPRRLVYVGVLWLGAALIWVYLIATMPLG